MAVVLNDRDIAQLGPLNRRLLSVGSTRAPVRLEWVIASYAARVLEQTPTYFTSDLRPPTFFD